MTSHLSTTLITASSNAAGETLTVSRINLVANTRTQSLLKYPIVIVYGFAHHPTDESESVAEMLLSQLGIEHYTPEIPQFGSIFERSNSLVDQIKNRYPGRTVHLLGHSMGGLNARDVATSSMTTDLGFKIRTVTTLATPHRGIKPIDFIPNLDDTNVFATALRDLIGTDLGSLGDMGHDDMIRYNETHQANPDVKYFTWAGHIRLATDHPNPIFSLTYPITRPFGPTDGLINVDSATWGPDLGGPGSHLGTIEGADHFSVMGPTAILGTIAHLRAAEDEEVAIVQELDGTKAGSGFHSVSGTMKSLFSPVWGVLSDFGVTRA